LGALSGISPKLAKLLVDLYGNAYEVYRRSAAELAQLDFLNARHVRLLTDPATRGGMDERLAALAGQGIDVISPEDAGYPELLAEICDAPPVLYMRGAAPIKPDDAPVAIVGTRRPTAYGASVARKLASDLARYGFTIVSGMAAGVDAAAHRAALDAGAKTVAVLGCGVEKAYPTSNRPLMNDIIKNGAVYSEYPPGSEPFQQNFPRRNRLISGMSLGVVVVEAGERSGALITAGFAGDQGKDVFAVPGNVTSPMSRGVNALIRDGAYVAASAEDIAYVLGRSYEIPGQTDGRQKGRDQLEQELMTGALNAGERAIVSFLTERGCNDIDAIAQACGMSAGEAGSVCVMLEIKGFVRRMDDGTYERDI